MRISSYAIELEILRTRERPLKVLCHSLSGRTVKIPWSWNGRAEPGDNPELFERLRKARLLVPDGQDEFQSFADHFPIARIGILRREGPGGSLVLTHRRGARLDCPESEVVETLLEGQAARVFRLCDGDRTLAQAARAFGDADKARTIFEETLCSPENQLIKLSREPWSAFSPVSFPAYLGAFQKSFKEEVPPPRGPAEPLPESEATVAFSFRGPSAALGGLGFGAALFDRLYENGLVYDGAAVLEAGSGRAEMRDAFLERARETIDGSGPGIAYELVRLMEPGGLPAALPEASADLILSNEAVAGLPVCALADERARALIGRHGIDVSDARGSLKFNCGAVAFLETVGKALRPGGTAVLTEFGGVASYPRPMSRHNENEYSIHFGHLTHAARRMGFKHVRLTDLQSFLRFNPRELMFGGDGGVLGRAAAALGKDLPPAAYAKSELDSVLGTGTLGGLIFTPLDSGKQFGPPLEKFKTLVLRT